MVIRDLICVSKYQDYPIEITGSLQLLSVVASADNRVDKTGK